MCYSTVWKWYLRKLIETPGRKLEKERNGKGDLSGGRERKKEKETIMENAGRGKRTGYGSHRMKKENVRDLGDQTEKSIAYAS